MRGSDNRIHETAIIADDVVLGDRNVIGPYTVISGPAVIGSDNWIGPSVAIGAPGEIYSVHHRASWEDGSGGLVRIGDRNKFREFATVQVAENTETVIGSDCYLMTKSHVAHDVVLADQVTLSCGVLIGGHCLIGQASNIGFNSAVHQFTVVGAGCMIGMGSVVTRHVLPFSMTYGSPARRRGVNVRGASRLGLSDADIADLADLYTRDDLDLGAVTFPEGAVPSITEWHEMQSNVTRVRPPA
jgi:UDP-N-acetylglucosamine acyltransferase